LTRRKASIALDLKSTSGIAFLENLVKYVDIVIDPFRPGVLEKLGLGYEVLQSINPKVILARMTGFRRDGKYEDMAGHDINYIAVSGELSLIGRKGEKPLAPANILGDFAGGGAMLFQGILLVLLAREKSGRGQVVEANMVDGSAYLTTFLRLLLKSPSWNYPRGENLLDGGAPWYDTYMTKDEKFMAVGAIEPQFFAVLLKALCLDNKGYEKSREDRRTWQELRESLESRFREKTRAEWEKIFDGTDACCAPVLDLKELETDPSREGNQRPAVALHGNPSLAIKYGGRIRGAREGQGDGILGDGWTAKGLSPGEGGHQVLKEWLGWEPGRHFEVENGSLVMAPTHKL